LPCKYEDNGYIRFNTYFHFYGILSAFEFYIFDNWGRKKGNYLSGPESTGTWKNIEVDEYSKNDKVLFPKKLEEKHNIHFKDAVINPRHKRILIKQLRRNPEILEKKQSDRPLILETANKDYIKGYAQVSIPNPNAQALTCSVRSSSNSHPSSSSLSASFLHLKTLIIFSSHSSGSVVSK
jgi:hypothetical protein